MIISTTQVRYYEKLTKGEVIPYLTGSELEFVRSTHDKLSDRSKEQWQHSATQLGAYALKRLETEDANTYMRVIHEESRLMADVLLAENDTTRSDYDQREAFNAWMYPAMRTIFTLDTCMDFFKDHNEGNMNVKLTPQALITLGRHALVEGSSFSYSTPLSVYPVLLRRSVTKMAEKVRQEGYWSNQFVWKKRATSEQPGE